MKKFLIGCTHFGHENIIRHANRPFKSVDEMDKAMIENWNKVVDPRDIVYHLGDFSFTGKVAPDQLEFYTKQLNGNIIFLQGNHDPYNWGPSYVSFKQMHNDTRRRVCLFHFPIEEWDGWFRGSVHFHAHTHSPEFISGERRGNVGADAINFTPIELTVAMDRLLSHSS